MTEKALAQVNNDIYDALGDAWYEADDNPVALLRAENRLRNPWIAAELAREFGAQACRVLDIGCGAGFLTNELARHGHYVTGLDASSESLAVAAKRDSTGRVRYVNGDALKLPFEAASFDAVSAMDFLEHVEEPGLVIAEAARVLRPGGLFIFHTFNRNPLTWLVAIKGVEWFVANTPEHLHVLRLFIKPSETRALCEKKGLAVLRMQGVAPVVFSRAFFRLLRTGRVGPDFCFRFTRSTAMAYTGIARKRVEA